MLRLSEEKIRLMVATTSRWREHFGSDTVKQQKPSTSSSTLTLTYDLLIILSKEPETSYFNIKTSESSVLDSGWYTRLLFHWLSIVSVPSAHKAMKLNRGFWQTFIKQYAAHPVGVLESLQRFTNLTLPHRITLLWSWPSNAPS